MNKKGTVYLLGDTNREKVYKIGVTRGDVNKRVKKLQTGNSGEIYVVDLYEAKFPFFVEQSLHRRYASKNVSNEWFELTLEESLDFKKICSEIENIAESLKDNPFFKYDKLK